MQTSATSNYDDKAFDILARDCQNHFLAMAKKHGDKVFTTSVDNDFLYEMYLSGFSGLEQRQIHTCNCCKQFFRNYGNLVFIDDSGAIIPAIWPEATHPLYSESIGNVRKMILTSKVAGVFLFSEDKWKNTCGSGAQWTHFEILPIGLARYASKVLTPSQAMAEKLEDFKNVSRAQAEFKPATVDLAIGLLESEALYRAEHIIGPAKFLRDVRGLRHALLWKAVANAPAGFCHPRSSMIGTLLEDLEAGMPFGDVKRRFAEKMHPLKYQRPQAPPSAGNIVAAEKLVEQMGIADSLKRRFATLADVVEHSIWQPAAPPASRAEGVFGHLKPKGQQDSPNLVLPPTTITWEKFVRTVLPTATKIEYLTVGYGDSFCGYLTAAVPSAPLIFQWNNPVSWYLYSGGSIASAWNLVHNSYVEVKAIVPQPNMWGGGCEHQGEGVLLVLDGCKDTKVAGPCLFPEILKSELRQVRSTIEAYSRSGRLSETTTSEQLASGISIQKSSSGAAPHCVRVTSAIGTASYKIDRWD